MTLSALSIMRRLDSWGTELDWVGPDPYEGLNTPLGGMVRSPRARQAVIQAYKRMPFSPPWPLTAPRRPNAKALALALSGYSQPAGATLPGAAQNQRRLPARIDDLRLELGAGSTAWGYHFSVQTRHLFYSDRTPNAIATCFVIEALIEASAGGQGSFFAYVASGSELIHNANLLVCAALSRLELLEPDEHARALVAEAVGTTLAAQRDDGLWPYGEARNLTWIDNFHTAYVLESLFVIGDSQDLGAGELAVGLEAWIECFLEPDGAARYYPDRRFPLEAHSYASAIDLLCIASAHDEGRRKELLDLAERLARSAIRELWLEKAGRFAFRRGPHSLNRRSFMRWTNAPMFRALSRLASALSEDPA
jgi:hypothetical protein